MRSQYGQEVNFLAVYIAEAHAIDEWPVGERLAITQHTTMDERILAAKRFIRNSGFELEMVVDAMEDSFLCALAAWPTRFYVALQGRLEYVAMPRTDHTYSIGEVEAWILAYQKRMDADQ